MAQFNYFLEVASFSQGETVNYTNIAREIRAINDYFSLEYTFYYWRTQSQIEVDFVAYEPLGLLAFEIKRRNELKPGDLKDLLTFKKITLLLNALFCIARPKRTLIVTL